MSHGQQAIEEDITSSMQIALRVSIIHKWKQPGT